ncbi:MAG: hypothetical protein K0R93_1018 [Anaerosolibacter sp.]|nr:hypothetical protein [Anaerosolibacter sp.]
MTDQVRQYCVQSIIRYLNGDFAEFDRLAAMACGIKGERL